ncbi:Ger(x)C family spore germination protein [Paenibacillus sp.]|uniref:Ger(x)C family spore germination protein n=1 Tax=Paenibacillus sp. TaxID=58172 RepID=UPI0028112810|nr:Ger(x)C family spore germination protein [Paenibacillus sp.]
MKIRLRTAAILAAFALILSGCWDSKSIDNRLLPVIMGVDRIPGRDGYIVSLRIPDPKSGEFHAIRAEAKTISEALDQIRMNEERSIDVLHLTLILLGRELAEEGVTDVLVYAMRAREIKSKAFLVITEGTAYEMIGGQKNVRKESGKQMLDLFSRDGGWTPYVALTSVWEGYRDAHSNTADMALPIIELGDNTLFHIVGSAAFRDGRIAEIISPEETFLYNLYRNRFKGAIVEVTDSASLQIVGANVSNRTSWKGDTPKLESTLRLKTIVMEANEGAAQSTEKIRKDLERMLNRRFRELMVKLQRNRSDILMTGVIFRNKLSPDQIEKWEERYYPKLDFDIRVQVDVRNTGNLKMPQ